MDLLLQNLLRDLLTRHIIGGKHVPERTIISDNTTHEPRNAVRAFEREYRDCLNRGWLIRLKKRTGRGSEWHISINPRMLCEIEEALNEEGGLP